MDSDHLVRGYAVFVNDNIPGEVAHGNDLVGSLHAPFLNTIDAGIDHVLSSTVEGRGMDMDNQRLASQFFRGYSSEIGEPIVGVDDIELILVLHRYRASYHSVAGDFLKQVGTIFPGKTVL